MKNNRIIDRTKTLLTTGLLIISQLLAMAQVNEEQQFLLKVGVKDSIYSQILDESRSIYVQLPADYSPVKDKKYPVAFILDGEVFLPTLNEVQRYYSGGFTPEMVLVGISNADHRTRDLTTSEIKEKYGMPFNDANGQADNFIDFIEKELIPFIENRYPVTTYRTLIGHSYGGLFAIHTMMTKPDLFANYMAIDPSLDWDNQKVLNEAEDILSRNSYIGKSLFMSLGGQLHMQNAEITIDNVMQDTSDYSLFARSNIAFSDLVRQNEQNGLSFYWEFYPNDLHGTITFPSLMDGLITVFEWYQMENTDKINSFDTPKNELYDIVKYREKKLRKHFGYLEPPYPEELLNMSGYMNMDMNQPEKAKMYFELAIEYYPQSANACDSMADYYESQDDIANALKFAGKAAELSDDDYYKNRFQSLKNK